MCSDAEERWFMAAPCKHCPFRRDVKPFLHPDRAEDIANATCNPYSDFTCHATLGEDEEGETCVGEDSLTCAGFLTMQINDETNDCPEGFTPSPLIYSDQYEMIDAYQEAWDQRGGRP